MTTLDGVELAELEQRIVDRTAELEATNKKLAHEVAERTNTEKQLRFQVQLLDSVRESVIATDLEGRVTYWGKGAERLYGYRAEEVIGHSITSFIVAPHEKQEEEQRMRTVRETGSWSGRYVQHRKDGSTFWADTFISLVTDEHGRPIGFIGIDRNVTDYKRAEEAVRESEARLTLAQEAAHIGTGDWDVLSDQVYWSNHQFHLHGMTPTVDNMISLKDWLALVHPEDREGSVDIVNGALKSGEGFSTEYRVVWPDGQTRWLCGTARVLRDDNGCPVRMIGVSIDVTERKRIEHGLRERTARLEGLIRTSAKVAATIETTETLDSIAEEAASLLGADGAGFRLLEGDRLVVAGTYGLARKVMLTPSIEIGQSLTGLVAQKGQAIAVSDLRHEQRFHEEHKKAAMMEGIVAYLGVPLRYHDRTIGVLNVYGKERHTFPETEIVLLQAFADQAAVAIERARLYDGTKRHAEELQIEIAERKRAEEALRESEQRFALAAQGANDGLWYRPDVSKDGEWWSSRWYELLGYEEHELEASRSSFEALLHPDDLARNRELMHAHLEKQTPYDTEYRLKTKSGEYRWYQCRAQAVWNEHGNPTKMAGSIRDITERRHAEEALSRFEHMVSASSDLMAFIDKTYTYLAANTAYVEALGKTKKEVVGKHMRDVLGGAAFDSRVKSNLDQCLSGKNINYQLWLDLPAHGTRYLDIRYDPYCDSTGAESGVVVGIRNITEHKKTEQALRESEMRYRSIVENAPLCIHEIDTSGRLISMNPAGVRMMRAKNQAEIIGMSYLDAVCTNERGRVKQLLKRALAGEPAVFDFNTTTKLGRRAFTSSFNPIRTADGTVEKLMGMIEDVTERKRSESEVLASHQRLRNLATRLQAVREEERTIIAREVHDELGQALTALKMDLAWIAKNLPDRWKVVPNRVHSMIALTDSTLSTVRQLSSRLRPAMLDDLGLEATIEWQLQDFTSRGNYECQIDLKAETLKPNKKRDIAVFRIFQEALTNIARHADARRISVRLQTKHDELLLVIRDDGKGISDDALTSAYSLGLTGMYERARTLGGSLKIGRDTRNGGTVLTLRVPLTLTKGLAHAS